ncbi:MAG: hypothetical protein ACFFBD_11890 [Candidatus Hodarchaeota archaeon]
MVNSQRLGRGEIIFQTYFITGIVYSLMLFLYDIVFFQESARDFALWTPLFYTFAMASWPLWVVVNIFFLGLRIPELVAVITVILISAYIAAKNEVVNKRLVS